MDTEGLACRATEARTHVDLLDVTVLLGGPSSEREVSLQSGSAVAAALARRGHRVSRADISPDDLSALERPGIEVVFIALHGSFGEDGRVQQLCEDRGLLYVGCGPRASAVAMDKVAGKQLFRQAHLPTPDWVVIEPALEPARRRELAAGVGLPCVVKPIDAGSSVGVSIARDASDRDAAVERLLASHGRAMVEAFVAGREMTVGVLDGRPLPVIEIRPARAFYDYFAKYQDDATQYIVNPEMSPEARRLLAESALAAWRALGCRDMSRVDFILDGEGRAHVLEVNTIPGFTSHSLLPKAAAAVGIGFDQLCDALVRMAWRRGGR